MLWQTCKSLSVLLAIAVTASSWTLPDWRGKDFPLPAVQAQIFPNVGDSDWNDLVLAEFLFWLGLEEDAFAVYERRIQYWQQQGNDHHLVTLLQGIAADLHRKGRLDQALAYYQQALIADDRARVNNSSANEPELWERHAILNQIALLQQIRGDVEGAIATFQQALLVDAQVTAQTGEQWAAAETLSGLGMTYHISGQTELALATYQQALADYQSLGGGHDEMLRLLNRMGLLYQAQGQFDAALRLYQQAFETAESSSTLVALDAAIHQVLALENISRLYRDQGNLEQANHYVQQAEHRLLKMAKSYPREGPSPEAVLEELGTFQLWNQQFDRAQEYF